MLDVNLEFHPAANVFPLLEGQDLKVLVDTMRERGYDPAHPIILFENRILDGRNRYIAANQAGVTPKFQVWTETDDDDPYQFVWRENAARRHLEPGTMACCWIKAQKGSAEWQPKREEARVAANARRREAAKEQHAVSKPYLGERIDGALSRDNAPSPDNRRNVEASKQTGVSEATFGRAFALETARPDLFDQVLKGDIKLNEALRLKRKAEVQAKLQDLPADKFRVFYADPPWEYGDKREEIGEGLNYGPVGGHYPSMKLTEICALDIKSIAHVDAVLFLWATSPLLPEGLQVMAAWGFKYKACFVWDKVAHNFGHYNSVRHELLLIGTRGSCLPEICKLIDSVQEIERSDDHSGKPAEFRNIIDTLYPSGGRIELFARGKLPEPWVAWGAEVANECRRIRTLP